VTMRLPAWIPWAVRRPHIILVPVAMATLFVCLAMLPVNGWGPRAASHATHLGTPPMLPSAPAQHAEPRRSLCDDLVQLESPALIGRLSAEQSACLEASLADAARPTDKKQISLLLIANANGKDDKRAWEALVQRHLRDIDRSDPDIGYAFAIHLARKGPGRAESVIRWSDVALASREKWTGERYKSRVYGLYKLRAAGANTLWRRAEENHAADPSDATDEAVRQTRRRLMTYSRDWYTLAKESGTDTTTPLQLCVSAAGTGAFCEDGG
jgi:hypothetical protein